VQAVSEAGARIENIQDISAGGPTAYERVMEPSELKAAFGQSPGFFSDTFAHFGRDDVPRGLDPHTGTKTIRFTLVGNSDRQVYVTGLVARIVSREQPFSGTLVYSHGEGANPNPQLGFDLDCADLNARTLNEDGQATGSHYLDTNQIALLRDEPVTIVFHVFTAACLCVFSFDVALSDGTHAELLFEGKPWILTAFASQYQRSYNYGPPTDGRLVACPYEGPNEIEEAADRLCR
jgi:hypothetical protein